MTNKRVFYGVYAVGISKDGVVAYTAVHGLQSVGITTTFNLEQVFEIGQINIYENIENIPDVELTLERVLDGNEPIYILATQQGTSASLTGRSVAKCLVALSVFNDTNDSASGTPLREVNMSGLLTSALTYTFPVDGNCTESVTLVGNHKMWKSSGFTFSGSLFTNLDAPPAVTGVQRRENVNMASSRWPAGDFGGIPGISSSGVNERVADVSQAHIQRASISTNLGRTAINELGRRNPYFRYVEFPVEVTTEIEVLDIDGDQVSCTEDGVVPGSGTNLADKTIKIVLDEGLTVDAGTRNKLSNVSYTGGDATGGNRTMTFTYTNFNSFKVIHSGDRSALA